MKYKMMFYDNEGIAIRSIVKFDIKKFANGLFERGWQPLPRNLTDEIINCGKAPFYYTA